MKSLLLSSYLLSLFFVSINCEDFKNAYMIFVGDNRTDYVNISLSGDVSKLRGVTEFMSIKYNKYYNPAKPTVMYASGWRSHYNSEDSVAMINAYLSKWRPIYNIVYIDWYNYTNNFVFVTSLGCIDGVSVTIMRTMERLRDDKLINFKMCNVHLIGFSMGAHLAQHIAKQVDMWTPLWDKCKVERLTGLDPIGLFNYSSWLFPIFGVEKFNEGRAKFTDCIHTSFGKFGLDGPTGDADFFMNGGETQPGCTAKKSMQEFLADQDINKIHRLASSHNRAWELYVESVRSPKGAFKCGVCKSKTYTNQSCPIGDRSAHMGFYAREDFKGILLENLEYFCQTSDGTSGKFSLT